MAKRRVISFKSPEKGMVRMSRVKKWELGDSVETEVRIGNSLIQVTGTVTDVIEQEKERSAIQQSYYYKYPLKSVDEVIGRTIKRVSFCEGDGIGAMGLTLDNDNMLILSLYGAGQYLRWNGNKVDNDHIWKAWKDRKITEFHLCEKYFSMEIGTGVLSFKDHEDDYFKLAESDDLRKAFFLLHSKKLYLLMKNWTLGYKSSSR